MHSKRGSATLIADIFLSILLTLTAALASHLIRAISVSKKDYQRAKAFHIAEGGLHKALWELSHSTDYAGEKETSLGEGAFTIEVLSVDGEMNKRIITSTGCTFHTKSPRVRLRAIVRLETEQSGKSIVTMEHWEMIK